MKILRSIEDLDSYGDRNSSKDLNSNGDFNRSLSSNRSFHYKSDNARKGLFSSSSSSWYEWDRAVDDDHESWRVTRKRSDHDFHTSGWRKGFDRFRDCSGDRGGGYGGGDRIIHRSESFCGSRREIPKGFRSERDRSRREGIVSSWKRFRSGNKDYEEAGRGSRIGLEEKGSVRSFMGLRDVKSPSWSKDSGSEQSRMRSPMAFRDVKSKSPSWSKDSGSEQSRMRSPRSPKVFRDMKSKSPSWSKDSGSEQSRMRSSRSPKTFKYVKSKSPTWSKDSGSEQSKNVEMKSEEVQVERENSSEMEEGELEPELEVGTENESPDHVVLDGSQRQTEMEHMVEDIGKDGEEKVSAVEEEEVNNGTVAEVENVKEEADELAGDKISDSGNKVEMVENDEGGQNEGSSIKDKYFEEEAKDTIAENSLHLEEESKVDKSTDLGGEADGTELKESPMDVIGENGSSEIKEPFAMECSNQIFKGKGKTVAVSPRFVVNSVEDEIWTEKESSDVMASRDKDMEGSTRGFELFSSSPVKRPEKADNSGVNKQKDEKLGLESLDLSLSLPNVLLPIGAQDTFHAPSSPSLARSVQSLTSTYCTNSDGFTASMSFSGSQSFFHNPSCSLTQCSLDNYEKSVGSRPIFQGFDWEGQSENESKHKDSPLYQRMMGNGQALQGICNGQAVQGQHLRPPEGSSKLSNGLDRQLSLHKHMSGGQPRHGDDTRSPSQSVGSHENGSNYSFDKKRRMTQKQGNSLYRSSSQNERVQLSTDRAGFADTIARIVSEPIHVMARKLNEMPGQSISCLKEGFCEFVLKANEHGKLHTFQKALQNRSDITLEVLLTSHRAQLEILVSLKTGLSDFLKQDSSIPYSDLAEIFLNLRCRNITCRSLLPVDECHCKVCAQKTGFCSACMCLVCSKFDMASNTCSWVGCDVCLHWCHVDCGLRESYIRNGHSATGTQGATEMQFHCVACDHPSEMFGFVKDVFQNFAKEWTAETFSKELEYVTRIFSASKDIRGKQLLEIANQMLARMTNKSNLAEVYGHITAFLTDNDSSKFADTPISSREEHAKRSTRVAGPCQENSWIKSVYSERTPQLEREASILPSFKYDQNGKRPVESELRRSVQKEPRFDEWESIMRMKQAEAKMLRGQVNYQSDRRPVESKLPRNVQKEPLFDELESIVRIKQAEAKMFQGRADDARREAEGLKLIAIAKNEKIEEDYKSRITKLRLFEAEEMRKQRYEELQALERAHRKYINMKMRMETDIKDLLLKMESMKRNLAI